MKKKYTIEIIGARNAGIWYANKIGRQFENAELVCRSYDTARQKGIVVFEVNPCNWVYPEDCKIISERLVEIYKP